MIVNKIINKIKLTHALSKLKYHGIDIKIGERFSINGKKNISIGSHFRGGRNIIIDTFTSYNGFSLGNNPKLIIGDNVSMTDNCYISCINEVLIGDGTLLGVNTFITDNFHGSSTYKEMKIPPSDRKLCSKGPVAIGKNVWTGRNVCIMPGVTIGDGAVIGANSVVTHNIPPYSIACGSPAKVIRINKSV